MTRPHPASSRPGVPAPAAIRRPKFDPKNSWFQKLANAFAFSQRGKWNIAVVGARASRLCGGKQAVEMEIAQKGRLKREFVMMVGAWGWCGRILTLPPVGRCCRAAMRSEA